LAEVGTLSFERPDLERFPALGLARKAGEQGFTYPTVLSAADEIAVEAFQSGKIGFLDIARIVERVIEAHSASALTEVGDVFEAEAWARRTAAEFVKRVGG
jgi:1-deoxy-D-xylulose-5-phosphate reductoisomerase